MFREADVAHLVPDHDETVGVRIGQRTNEDRVDRAEHRRVDPDAERQRRRKRRIAPEQAQRVAHVAGDVRQPYC